MAVCTFNDGFKSKVELFVKLRHHPGKHLVNAIKILESDRLREAERENEELQKVIINKRALKRKNSSEDLFENNEDHDNPSYSAGHY